MLAYRVETTVVKGHSIVIEGVPFEERKAVEVIVLEGGARLPREPGKRYPLRGTPYRYDSPAEPISVDDWEALT